MENNLESTNGEIWNKFKKDENLEFEDEESEIQAYNFFCCGMKCALEIFRSSRKNSEMKNSEMN